MRTIITKSWEFRTYSVKGTCKCSKCGKPITKTFSFQTREDVLTQKEDWNRIEQQKQEWLKKSHICNNCKKEKILQERKNITPDFTFMFSKIIELQNQINQIALDKRQRINFIKSDLVDKIIIDKNNVEWVINSIQDLNDIGFEIGCYKINKQKPWIRTDEKRYFYGGNEVRYDNYSKISECVITDEMFSKRKQLLNEVIND